MDRRSLVIFDEFIFDISGELSRVQTGLEKLWRDMEMHCRILVTFDKFIFDISGEFSRVQTGLENR